MKQLRNSIHYYLGAIIPYKALSYTIIDMNELQMFIIKIVSCILMSAFLGCIIELYQSWVLKQFIDWNDVKRTIVGGIAGGIICVADQHLKFMTTYLFYLSIVIIIAELIRSQIVLRKKTNLK